MMVLILRSNFRSLLYTTYHPSHSVDVKQALFVLTNQRHESLWHLSSRENL
jgi:hypothetical protein